MLDLAPIKAQFGVAPIRDITAELADVRRSTPEVYVVTPEQAARIVDQLVAMGARQTAAGRWALAWFGRIEEQTESGEVVQWTQKSRSPRYAAPAETK